MEIYQSYWRYLLWNFHDKFHSSRSFFVPLEMIYTRKIFIVNTSKFRHSTSQPNPHPTNFHQSDSKDFFAFSHSSPWKLKRRNNFDVVTSLLAVEGLKKNNVARLGVVLSENIEYFRSLIHDDKIKLKLISPTQLSREIHNNSPLNSHRRTSLNNHNLLET